MVGPPAEDDLFRVIRLLRNAAILFVLWTIFGLLSSAHFFFGYEGATSAGSFLRLADNVIVFYWGWALVTPLVFMIARRVSRGGLPSMGGWATLMLAAIGMVLVHGAIHLTLTALFGIHDKPLSIPQLADYVRRHGGGDLATFFVLVGATMLIETNKRAARADLELLRWHLHPHFLFNALNTVSTLVISGNARGAENALTLISRYLRSALDQRADSMVPLSSELDMLERYLEIEKLRFGESMRIDVRADKSSLDVMVPGLIIQPIVENAIRHGAARLPGADPISINANAGDGRLRISIVNPTSAGMNGKRETEGARFGVRYVRERLRQFYGSRATFDLDIGEAKTVATIDIPVARAS